MSSPFPTRALRGLAGAAVLFALLEAVTRAHIVDPTYLPPASSVLATTATLLTDPGFLAQVGATLAAWAVGLLSAVAIGVPLGILLGSSARWYAASITAIEFVRPVPSVALIPLAILLLGQDLDMKAALVAFASLWPVLFNTIYGMHEVDPVARDTARAFGYGRLAVARMVALPSAAPFIYTGIRVAAAFALILAVATELIAGGSLGLGAWMARMSETGVDRRFLYAGIVVTGLLGLVINAAMVAAERRLFGWHHRVRAA